jgi:hypothetical protein
MISSSGLEGLDVSCIEQNRQSIRNLLVDLENSFRAGPKGGFPVENHFAVVTDAAIVAAHVVGGIDSGGARLAWRTYLVRFPLVCQS